MYPGQSIDKVQKSGISNRWMPLKKEAAIEVRPSAVARS